MKKLSTFAFLFMSLGSLCAVACGPSSGGNTGGSGGTGGGAAGTTETGGGGTAETGGGGASGCSPSKPCAQGYFCDYPDDLCGQGKATGACVEAPVSDCGPAPRACGCDGVVGESCYGAVGLGDAVDIASPDQCEVPAGAFVCGHFYCDPAEGQYCQGSLNLTTCGEDYTCAPIPSACADNPTCDCITAEDYLITCSGDAMTGITGDLPGGDSRQCP